MTTRKENDTMTRVGPGTPAGELLRRYWHPVAVAGELTEEKPVKAVKMLGERLAVFRMAPAPGESQPRFGLVGEECPHRLASLAYGWTDNDGIRCPYHGWKFSSGGACIEQPAEPPESTYKDRIRIQAYPVQKLAGLLFAYMGPLPAPLLPRWDVLAREDGRRWNVIESVIDCNWLQSMENSVDPAHLYWLHGGLGAPNSPVGAARFRALGVPAQYQEKHEFFRVEHGLMKRRITQGKTPDAPPLVEQHPMVFPLGLRLVLALDSVKAQGYAAASTITPEEYKQGYLHNMQLRVPIDDTHIQQFHVSFIPSATARSSPDEDPPFEYCELKSPDGVYNMNVVTAQDTLAWETQGALTDRTREHLATSDRGVVMLRRLLKEQLDIVRSGGDPMGVIRDPEKNRIIDLQVIHEPFGLLRTKEQDKELTGVS